MAQPSSSHGLARWLPWLCGGLAGAVLALLGLVAVLALGELGESASDAHEESAHSGDAEQSTSSDSAADAGLPISGEVHTTVKDFRLDDASGQSVLSVAKLTAEVEADGLRQQRLLLPRGEASDIELLLRPGAKGRVSLADAFRGGEAKQRAKEGQSKDGLLLSVGPISATNIRLRVEMGESPVVMQLSSARLRVVRDSLEQEPRIFLSAVQGRLVSPDPLPNPIEIHDGGGVIQLAGDPLVDLRVRVCVSGGELRLNVRVTREPDTKTTLIVDGERFAGMVSAGALQVVDWFKDTVNVRRGRVDVEGSRSCEQ